MPDVVIAARDEEATVGGVVRAWVLAGAPHVFVVDDRSGDGTAAAAWAHGAIVLPGPGRGKGAAMTAGLARVTTGRVAFADGDLDGFTARHAAALADPFAGQAVGLRDNGSAAFSRLPPVSGERVLPTALARSAVLRGWGPELALDAAAGRAGLPVRHIVMAGVTGRSRPGPVAAARIAPWAAWHAPGLAAYVAQRNLRGWR